MQNQSVVLQGINEKLQNANQFITDNQNVYQSTAQINAPQLANLFKQSLTLENEIYLQMQQVLQTIEVNNSSQPGAVSNLDNALKTIEQYKTVLVDLDKFQQEITKRYQNLSHSNDKKLFMSSVLNCDPSDPNVNLYDNLLQKFQYAESKRIQGNLTFVPINDPADPNKISFDTDLLKLMSTKTGLNQLKDINQKLEKLSNTQSGKVKVSFRDDRDSMSYSQNSKDVKYNKQEVEDFNHKHQNDTVGYIKDVSPGIPDKFIEKPSELPGDKVQTILYPKTSAREKVTVKIGEKDGVACICVSPRIASFSHELGHMQRAMQGQFEKDVPVPKMFEQTYDNLEEFYTVLLENKLLDELGLPPRITHGGTVIDPNKLNDQSYLTSLDNAMMLFLSKGNVVLGNLTNIFDDVKENVRIHAQQLTSQMGNLSTTTRDEIKKKLEEEVNPKSVLSSSNVITINLSEESVTDIHNIIMDNINLSPNIQQAVLDVIKDCESTKLGNLSTDKVISKVKQAMLDSIPKDLIKNEVDKAISQSTPNRSQVVEDIAYNIKREYEKFIEKKIVADLIANDLKPKNIDKVMDELKQEFNSNLQHLYVLQFNRPLVEQATPTTSQKEGWQSSTSHDKFVQIAEEHKQIPEEKKTTPEPETVIPVPVVNQTTQEENPSLQRSRGLSQ